MIYTIKVNVLKNKKYKIILAKNLDNNYKQVKIILTNDIKKDFTKKIKNFVNENNNSLYNYKFILDINRNINNYDLISQKVFNFSEYLVK